MRRAFALLFIILALAGISYAQATGGGGVPGGNGSSTIINPESYGAVGNGNTYFDGAMAGIQVWAESTGTSTTPSSPTITTVTNNDKVLNIWETNAAWSTLPATGTNRINLTYASGEYGMTLNDQTVATAGSVAASTGTVSSSSIWQGMTIPLLPTGGAAPTFVAETAVKQSSGLTLTVSVPAGVVNGDFMVACVGYYGTSTNTNIVTPPAGWVWIAHQLDSGHNNLMCATRVASSEPASYVWTQSKSDGISGIIAAYSASPGIDGQVSVLTSATAAFPSTASGDLICVAGINGVTAPASQACGTITGYNSATSVNLSFGATSPMTGAQFAYGTSDQSAFNTILSSTACTSNPGCKIHLSDKGYVLNGSLILPANVPISIEGQGMGVNNTANSFINSNALPNASNGSRLMFLTSSLTTAAVSVTGTLHVTSTTAYDTLKDLSIYGGTGYARDGGGTAIDCLDVLNWQGFDATNVGCFGFSGNARYVDGLAASGFQDYTESISFHHFYASYNGGAGLKMGSSNALNLEGTSDESGIIEANGGPAFWLVGPGIEGFLVQNDVFQWNNYSLSATFNPEILATGATIVGCSFKGNYAEADAGGITPGSQSNGIFNTTATPGVAALINCDMDQATNYWNQNGSGTAPKINAFSAAAVAIPSCTAVAGTDHVNACVSDSTLCTNGTTYTSGGSAICKLQCNGTNWIETGSSVGCN